MILKYQCLTMYLIHMHFFPRIVDYTNEKELQIVVFKAIYNTERKTVTIKKRYQLYIK